MSYYDILEINKDASYDDIKKAYRKLARKYHPDKNKAADAEEKFKMISEAYQTLSDQKLKNNYDNYGKVPDNFMTPEEIYTKIFSNMDPILGSFLTETLTKFTNNLMDEKKSLKQLFEDFNTEDMLDKGSDIMKHYLKKNIKPTDKSLSFNMIYTLELDCSELDDENDIDVDIDFLRKYSHIKLILTYEGEKKKYIFNLQDIYYTVEISEKIYYFEIIYKFPPGIFRKDNSSNIYLTYDIDYNSYKNGFRFNYPLSKKTTLDYNVIIKESNIVCFEEMGLYSFNTNKYGNFYVTFRPTESLSEESMGNDLPLVYSMDTYSVVN
jgi:DnaJ-class molecular chaperone